MSGGTIAVVIVVVIVIIAALATTALMTRRRRLRLQFGPEYDRAVTEQNSKLRAEAELTDRQRRVRKLDIRPLSEAVRARYAADWVVVQERFVDDPQAAMADAYSLLTTVMTERGYPAGDDEQVLAVLSVEHARTVGHLRAAQDIGRSAAAGNAVTEDLRQALIHYRALFSDLLGVALAPAFTSDACTSNAPYTNGGVAPAASRSDSYGVVVGTPAPDQPQSLQ